MPLLVLLVARSLDAILVISLKALVLGVRASLHKMCIICTFRTNICTDLTADMATDIAADITVDHSGVLYTQLLTLDVDLTDFDTKICTDKPDGHVDFVGESQ